jgi:hypothetical protein
MQNKKIIIASIVTVLLATVTYFSISEDHDDDRDSIPDISHIKANVKINRFEKAVFAIDTNNIIGGLQQLQKQYPDFTNFFIAEIINDGRFKDSAQIIGGFIKSPYTRALQDSVQITFDDMTDVEKELSQAFRYYKYYFPNKPIPAVNTIISEYSKGVFMYGDSTLCIGLDFFLGAQHGAYDAIEIPRYESRTYNKAHLVSTATQAVILNLMPEKPVGNRLLDAMIDNGKQLYILDKLLPSTPDSIKFKYTTAQLNWCRKNEGETWAHILSEKMLYSVKRAEWIKLVEPSPTGTPKMPVESPGRVGNYIGYRIIKAYMKKFPSTTLEQLIALPDAQKILDLSKYKPKRK